MSEQEEQSYLNRIEEDIAQEIKETSAHIEKEKEDVLKLKQYLYEASASDMDEEEIISNMQSINQTVALTDLDIRKKDLLEHQKKSPYFGKMMFRFDDDGEILPVYVGMNGYWSGTKEEQLVFDWRAPVSSLFYDFEKGGACYEAPMGEVTGDIIDKKQIRITEGKLDYVLDTDRVINDELLVAELKKNSSQKMRSVAATIQKQQNAIIRNHTAKTLVVDGRAGSGKTVIALHRVAWLLYNYRKSMKSENVMILSPNGVFSDYISGILPEMGEDNAPEKEWDDLMSEILFIDAEYETKMEQADRILNSHAADEERIRNIRRKSSIAFFEKFNAYVKNYVDTKIEFDDFHFEKITFPKIRMERLFHDTFKQYPPYERFLHIASFVIDDMEEATGKQYGGGRRERLLRQIQNEMIIRFAERNIVVIYQSFLAELAEKRLTEEQLAGDDRSGKIMPEKESGVGAEIQNFLNEEGKICYEDILPIMFLQVSLYGCHTYQNIKHLVIDEMQDYTIFQYAVLERMFGCPKTILGDKYQVLFYDEKETIVDVLKYIFPEQELVVLDTAYRSTKQITDFCNRILGKDDIAAYARDGKEPQVRHVSGKEELILELRKTLTALSGENYENIAVLTDDEDTAGQIYMELREDMEVSVISENSAVYFGGIVMVPKFFAKGMEFDAVCVVNEKKRTDDVVALHEYYISCTRALHELYVFELEKED